MARDFARMWAAVAYYEGRPRFIFGNVVADGEEHARVLIEKKMALVFPTAPNIAHVMPGALIFVPDAAAEQEEQ
jgi:hypothetical protein